jgi:hypothetical protein
VVNSTDESGQERIRRGTQGNAEKTTAKNIRDKSRKDSGKRA